MRRRLSLCLLCLLLLISAGCGTKTSGPDTASGIKLDLAETAYDLATAAGFETTYNADASFLSKDYSFDEAAVTGYKALFGTMLDANRLALFEVTDDDQRKAAKETAQKIGEQLKTSFSDDMPEQKAQAEAAQTVENGNYVLFISGVDVQAGVDAFNQLFETAATP